MRTSRPVGSGRLAAASLVALVAVLGAQAGSLILLAVLIPHGAWLSLALVPLVVAEVLLGPRLLLGLLGARGVADGTSPGLDGRVHRLAALADVPPPRLAVSPRREPFALLVGGIAGRATLCVSAGAVESLGDAELEAVLAHEIAHAAMRDATLITLVTAPATLLGVVLDLWWWVGSAPGVERAAAAPLRTEGVAAWIGVGAVVAVYFPLFVAATVLRILLVPVILVVAVAYVVPLPATRWLGRVREAAADRYGAILCGSPTSLASALLALDDGLAEIPREDLRSLAPLSAMLVVPVPTGGIFTGAVTGHPPTADRVARLLELQRDLDRAVRGR